VQGSSGTDPESRTPRTGEELASEAERARTPRTPALALASVWVAIVVVFAIVVGVTLYFALR
jgi:hypothetical protein